jgi:chaperonin GroES
MNIRPLHDNILVEYTPPTDRTDGGIILPDVAKVRPTKAKVLATGPGKRTSDGRILPMPCPPGDTVLVSLSGEVVGEEGGKQKRIVSSEDILAVEVKEFNEE